MQLELDARVAHLDGDEPAITDNGNYIVDLEFADPLEDAPAAAAQQCQAWYAGNPESWEAAWVKMFALEHTAPERQSSGRAARSRVSALSALTACVR